MNVRRWLSLSLTASAVALAAACSSSSSSDDSATGGNDAGGGSDSTTGGNDAGGGSKDSGGGGATCSLADGTYLMHYTAKSGNSDNCTVPPDHTVTYPLDAGTIDAGTVDAGGSCTNSQNQTSTECTNSISCTSDISGFMNTLVVSVTISSGGTAATGEEDDTLTYPDGGTKVCDFTVTFTKQ